MKTKTTLIAAFGLLLGSATVHSQSPAPENRIAFTGKPQYQIVTKQAGAVLGTIKVELFPLIAPLHVKNFDDLVKVKFYDTTAFHRVIPKFMIQGGDPNSRHGKKSTWGEGDPSQPKVKAEFSPALHVRGTLSAARTDDVNSATSQFFICVTAYPSLNGKYSVYGQVVSGLTTVDQIVNSPRDANDNPNQKIEMFITYLGSNDSIPKGPVLVSPAKGTKDVTTSRLLTWTAAGGAILYNLEVATDSLFSNLFFTTALASTTTSYTVTNLKNNSKYYWRVKTNNGGNYGPSEVWHFTTTGFTGIHDLVEPTKEYNLQQNIPNPCNSQTIINYALPVAGKVVLTIYDMQGRELRVLVNEIKDKGQYEVKLALDNLAQGVYFYKLQANSFTSTKRLIRN